MSRPGDYVVVEWSGGGGIGHYSYLLADALARAGLPGVLATRAGHELAGRVPQAARVREVWPRAPRRLSRARPSGRHRGDLGSAAGCGWSEGPWPPACAALPRSCTCRRPSRRPSSSSSPCCGRSRAAWS